MKKNYYKVLSVLLIVFSALVCLSSCGKEFEEAFGTKNKSSLSVNKKRQLVYEAICGVSHKYSTTGFYLSLTNKKDGDWLWQDEFNLKWKNEVLDLQKLKVGDVLPQPRSVYYNPMTSLMLAEWRAVYLSGSIEVNSIDLEKGKIKLQFKNFKIETTTGYITVGQDNREDKKIYIFDGELHIDEINYNNY